MVAYDRSEATTGHIPVSLEAFTTEQHDPNRGRGCEREEKGPSNPGGRTSFFLTLPTSPPTSLLIRSFVSIDLLIGIFAWRTGGGG